MNSASLALQGFSGPVPRFSPMDLERLDILPPISRMTGDPALLEEPVDWNQVHLLIQRILGKMSVQVRARWPMIRSRSGKSSARSYFLFTYMTFELEGEESLESVIVGLNFAPAPSGGGILISGDISGEESGRIDFEIADRTVPPARGELIPVALDMASHLAERSTLIAKKVLERHPPPQY